jgi:uncharacterized protein YjiS (DUF1127 family)
MDTGLRHQGLRTINAGELLQLRDAAGRHLTVVQGAVWVTQHGDWRDAVLESGASFRFDRNGLSIVQALGSPATVVLEEGLEPASQAGHEAGAAEPQAWKLAHSERFERRARRMRADTLASLSDHLLRDLGFQRDQVQLGGRTPECAHC